MNRDDIIRWAREAAILDAMDCQYPTVEQALKRFAALVAAAERDAEIAALRHRVRELEHAMRLVGIDHATMLKVAAAIHGRPL